MGLNSEKDMRCKILLLEEILKRYKKNDALNYGKIICSDGSILDFDLSPSLKLYIELIKEISKDL